MTRVSKRKVDEGFSLEYQICFGFALLFYINNWSGVEWSRGEHSRAEPSGKKGSEVSREERREVEMYGDE